MKKLIVLVILLALMPAVVPARGEALTLSQRVARLEAKLNCLRRVSVAEYDDVAVYGSRRRAQCHEHVRHPADEQPRQRQPGRADGSGLLHRARLAFTDLPPDYWVLAIKTDASNVPASGCLAKFGAQVKPSRLPRAIEMMRLRQLAGAQ